MISKARLSSRCESTCGRGGMAFSGALCTWTWKLGKCERLTLCERMRILLCLFLDFGGILGTRSWSKRTYEESASTSQAESSAGNARHSQHGARAGFGGAARQDLYSVLGVPTSADEEDIRKAYMKLALKYHPDRHSTKSEEERERMRRKFLRVKEAYDTLSDSKERRKYDEKNRMETGLFDTNLDDLLKDEMTRSWFGRSFFESGSSSFMSSNFGADSFESFRRRFANAHPRRKETPTVEIEIPATLDELFNGMLVTYRIRRKTSGTTEEKVMVFRVKPGYKAGTSITFHGYGNELSDGTFQDVRLVLVEKPHPVFKRVDDDLVMCVEIGLQELIEGFQKRIELPGNRTYTLTHRELDKIGEYITIPSLGMPLHRDPSKRGDLHIKATMAVPQLTSVQRMRILSNLSPLHDEE